MGSPATSLPKSTTRYDWRFSASVQFSDWTDPTGLLCMDLAADYDGSYGGGPASGAWQPYGEFGYHPPAFVIRKSGGTYTIGLNRSETSLAAHFDTVIDPIIWHCESHPYPAVPTATEVSGGMRATHAVGPGGWVRVGLRIMWHEPVAGTWYGRMEWSVDGNLVETRAMDSSAYALLPRVAWDGQDGIGHGTGLPGDSMPVAPRRPGHPLMYPGHSTARARILSADQPATDPGAVWRVKDLCVSVNGVTRLLDQCNGWTRASILTTGTTRWGRCNYGFGTWLTTTRSATRPAGIEATWSDLPPRRSDYLATALDGSETRTTRTAHTGGWPRTARSLVAETAAGGLSREMLRRVAPDSQEDALREAAINVEASAFLPGRPAQFHDSSGGVGSFDYDKHPAAPTAGQWWQPVDTDRVVPQHVIGELEHWQPVGIGYEPVDTSDGTRYRPTLACETDNSLKRSRDSVIISEDCHGAVDPVSGAVSLVALQEEWYTVESTLWPAYLHLVRQDIASAGGEYTPREPEIVYSWLQPGHTDPVIYGHRILDCYITQTGRLLAAVLVMAQQVEPADHLVIIDQPTPGAAGRVLFTADGLAPATGEARFITDRVSGECWLAMQRPNGLTMLPIPAAPQDVTALAPHALPASEPVTPYGAYLADSPVELRDDRRHQHMGTRIEPSGRWRVRWRFRSQYLPPDIAEWPIVDVVIPQDRVAGVHPLCDAAAWADGSLLEVA